MFSGSKILYLLPCLFLCACTGKKSDSGAAPATSQTINSIPGTGTLAIDLEPKEGALEDSVAGANVVVYGNSELAAVADENGKVTLPNVSPGTISIVVTSVDGSTLLLKGSKFGLKIDEIKVKPNEMTDLGTQILKETGSISGVVDFYSNPNNLDLTGSDIFIPGTSFVAKSDVEGKFTLSGIPEGNYSLRAQHTGFAPLDISAVTVTESENTDIGEMLLSLSTGPEGGVAVVADATVTINGETKSVITNEDRKVKLNLIYDGDAALMKISHEPSFLNKEWQPVAKSFLFSDFDSDGAKSIYVMYSDLNGLESSPYQVEFIIDTEVPANPAITIMSNWDQISSAAINMRVSVSASDSGTGVEKMMICTVNNFESCGSWVDYEEEITNIPLSSNLFVRFKDHVGRVSTVATDQVNQGSHTIIAGGTYSGDLLLSAAQSPYRFDSDIVVKGNMTISSGVTIDHGGAGSKSITVLGRLLAQGTSLDPITLTESTGSWGSINLTDSTADNNSLQYIVVEDGVIGTSPLIKINGGVISHMTVDNSGGFGGIFVEKSGYKSFELSENSITRAKIQVAGGNATTIRKNILDGNICSVLLFSGGSDTLVEYNTIDTTCTAASTPVKAIEITAGDVLLEYNDITHVCGDTGVSIGIDISGGGTATVNHNNFDITSQTNTNVQHLKSTSSTITANQNYYFGHATTNPNTSGAGITSTNHEGSAWPTSGATNCVGASCP